MKVRWSTEPEPHDYPAAQAYLGLLVEPDAAASLVQLLATQPVTLHKAKDILRAARLPLLPVDDPYVAGDLKAIRAGKRLSPVLLVRGDLGGAPLQIADGYHRVCASYHASEDADVSAQLVAAPVRR